MRKVLVILFFVLLLISQAYAHTVPVNVSVLPTINAEVIDLYMDNDPVISLMSTNFIVVIENTGNIAINATAQINITNSSGYLVDTLIFDPTEIPAFGVVTFVKSWNSGNNSIGMYNATSKATYENFTTSEVTRSFSIILKPKNYNIDGFTYTLEEKKIIPTNQDELVLEFLKIPVLIETLPGDCVLSSIEIGNPTNETLELNVHTNIERIDSEDESEMVRIIPDSLSIPPNESKKLNIIVSIPTDVSIKDYLVLIRVGNEIFEDENFFILRVSSKNSDYSHPIIKRSVVIDNKKNVTSVSLNIENSEIPIRTLEIIEQIPKEMAPSVGEILFETEPMILLDGPLVKWRFDDLIPNEKNMIHYEIPWVLEDCSLYIYWPVKQMNIFNYYEPTSDESLDKIRISDISSPSLLPGRSGEVTFRVTNFNDDPVEIDINMELPAHWAVKIDENKRLIQPRSTVTHSIQVTPHSSTSSGTYLANIWISYDDVDIREGITLLVGSQSSFRWFNLPILAFISVFLLVIHFLIYFKKVDGV
ncbi:MAG: hypothetical protein SVY15_00235 [Halobacteriota archaeon]|nr:hypothetical protein [Halobacteriota archaeon]